MSVTVTFNGTSYTIPSPGQVGWADTLNAFLKAIGTRFSTERLVCTGTAAAAPLRVATMAAAPTGPNVVGDLYMTTAGVLKVCTVAGSPGTFVSVGAQV